VLVNILMDVAPKTPSTSPLIETVLPPAFLDFPRMFHVVCPSGKFSEAWVLFW